MLKTCPAGHQFQKSSDCPVCPICEKDGKPQIGFLSLISAPARRALEREGITTLQKLSSYSESELLQLHGIGKSSIPNLVKVLNENGLDFKK